MDKFKVARAFSILAFFFTVSSALFFNCAKPNDISAADENSASQNHSASPLAMIVTPTNLTEGSSALAEASGGTPPYTYSLPNGNGAIDQTGVISGQTETGSLEVEVIDSVGSTYVTTIQVSLGGVSTTGTCVYNGMVITNGGSVTGYAAAAVGCGSTCSSATITCTNGQLSSNAASYASAGCSATVCQWEATSTSCASPVTTSLSGACTAQGSQECVGTSYSTTYDGYVTVHTTGAVYVCQ